MSDNFFDGQIPSYRSSYLTKSVKIDPDNNSIIINDTITNKILNINAQQLSNNSGQSLLFSDIYLTVKKTPSITYPPTNSNTLNIKNSIVLTDRTITNTLSNISWTLSNCSLSVYLELINNNNSTLTTITTSGSSFFDSVNKTF